MENEQDQSVQKDEYTGLSFMDVVDQFCANLMGQDYDSNSVSFKLADLWPVDMIYFFIDYIVLGDNEGLLAYR